MNKLTISIVALVVISGSLLLFQATRAERSLVLTPSELAAMENGSHDARIRVAGRVKEASVQYETEPKLKLAFAIEDPGQTGQEVNVPVIYAGLKPDMFAAGRDVILDGRFSDGVFTASKLMTQCPSKYEPPQPGE